MIARCIDFFVELSRRKVTRTAGAYLVMSFIVMQIVDDVFPYVPGVSVETAGTLIFVILAAGFPLALGLAWAVELTPSGIRKELSAEEAKSLAGEPTRAAKPLRSDSVAVLPFENLSADPEDEYFSDGVTDDIIMAVASIPGLRVISRTSVMKYKKVATDVEEIARELGVGTIIGGSVRRDGTKVRVVVEVVDARSDSHLWSDTYDRELRDIFRVQSEVAGSVARAVRLELSRAARQVIEGRGTRDAKAYDLYLRGLFHWNQRSEAPVARSLAYFERALERDPGFALAHAGLADANTILAIYGALEPSGVMEAARRSAKAALAIDPTLGQAHASLACVNAVFDWKWEEAEAGFRRALEAASSYATAHHWLALNVLMPCGRFPEASVELDLAEQLDPQSAIISTSRGILSFYARDYSHALEALEGAVQMHPRFALAHYFLGLCRHAAGDPDQSLEPLREASRLSDESSETLVALCHAHAATGQVREAEAIARRVGERQRIRYVSPVLFAHIEIGRGDVEAALTHLEEAAGIRAIDLVWIGVKPVFDPLRDEARFQALIERVGLPQSP